MLDSARTLDVLNQQQDVINAQINLAQSERDVVVGSYAISVGNRRVDLSEAWPAGRDVQSARTL